MSRLQPSFIVGIGGSAGGLKAYKALLDALPPNTGKDFTAKAEQPERPRVPAIVNRPYETANPSFVPLKLSLNRPRN